MGDPYVCVGQQSGCCCPNPQEVVEQEVETDKLEAICNDDHLKGMLKQARCAIKCIGKKLKELEIGEISKKEAEKEELKTKLEQIEKEKKCFQCKIWELEEQIDCGCETIKKLEDELKDTKDTVKCLLTCLQKGPCASKEEEEEKKPHSGNCVTPSDNRDCPEGGEGAGEIGDDGGSLQSEEES